MVLHDFTPHFSTKNNGQPVIDLEEHGYHLEVKHTRKNWLFRINDFMDPPRPKCTAWAVLDDPSKFETSRRTKVIREVYKHLYGDTAPVKINDTLHVIQLYETYFKQEQDTQTPQSLEDLPVQEKIVRTIIEQQVEFFQDQHGEPHVRIPRVPLNDARDANDAISYTSKVFDELLNNNRSDQEVNNRKNCVTCVIASLEIHRVYGRAFREYIAGLMWQQHELAPKSDQVASALSVFAALAQEGGKRKLYNRVCEDQNGDWWIDMSNDQWFALRVTDEAWMIDIPPAVFRRYSHQLPLPIPADPGKGSVKSLLDYVSLKSVDDQLLWLVSQIAYLVPGVPHAITLLWGQKGAVKSTGMRVVKEIFDNSSVGLLQMPAQRKPNELIQVLDHHYLAFFDNLSKIDDGQSDILCRAVTGGGLSKRRLYTDDDDITRQFIRGVGLNGINLPAHKADLLDRAILLEAQPIAPETRKTEKELRGKLDEEAPLILGGALDVLVKARNIVKDLYIRELNRMADFTLWGAAITQALGIDYNKFLVAYRDNIASHEEESVRANVIGEVLTSFLDSVLASSEQVTYKPTVFYGVLTEAARDLGYSTKRGDWPGNSRALGESLNEIATNLPSVGYVLRKKRTSEERIYAFSKRKQATLEADYEYGLAEHNVWPVDDLRDLLDVEEEL